ncbi:MAG: trigger factor, partial [Coriobacteriia bacterium]|nr:trigger factor [Coriobacteriia bacterium]
AYAAVGAKLRIPGFRPGKAPRPVIDTHIGREAVLADAQEEVVSDSYGRAVSELGVRTIGRPDVGELDMIEPGTEFTYVAEVRLRPELTLTDATDFTVTVPSKVATDREVDAQIEQVRERFATLESGETPVAENDFALISFVGTVDGEPYDGNTVDKYLYELGRGMMPEEFDAALIGVEAGGSVVAEFEIPDTSSNDEFVGKQARFEIEVHEVKTKVLPELNDEFAASAGGFDTMDEYRADVREKLDSAKLAGHGREVENAILAELVSRLEGEVPDEMIDSRANTMAREFFESMEERGLSPMDYMQATGMTAERLESDLREQANGRVREELALEALFAAQGFEVSDEDLRDAVREIAGGDTEAAAELNADLARNGALPLVKEQVIHRRTLKWLMDNAEVIEEEQS